MIRLVLGTLAAVGGFVLWRMALERQRLPYRDPKSLILDLERSAITPRNDTGVEAHWYAERLVPLEGVANFRDLGGYRTADGRCVRWGQVFRSGMMANLTDADREWMRQAGLKLVCDLRHPSEVAKAPDALPRNPGPAYLHLPQVEDDLRRRQLKALLIDRREIAAILPDLYVRVMIERNAKVYGELLRRLAEPDNLPAVFHCSAGKDRTGIAAALLLLALGVPESTVLADYTLSNLAYEYNLSYAHGVVRRFGVLGIRADDMQPMLIADAQNLQSALDHIRTKYGSLAVYLQTAAGLDAAVIERLKATLLE